MSEGERVTIPMFDMPVQLIPPLPKEALERVQLEKFRLDYLVRFGRVPFDGERATERHPQGSRHRAEGVEGVYLEGTRRENSATARDRWAERGTR